MSGDHPPGGLAETIDRRFVCQECGTKWFVPAGAPAHDDPETCAACAGPLAPMAVNGQPAARS
jgi:hypothetical protein